MAASFRIEETVALGKWIKEGTRKAALSGIYSAALRGLGEVQGIIAAEDPQPVDRAIYKDAWKVERTESGADLVNDVPYATIIEYGVRPENIKIGNLMIEALAEWAMRKGLADKPAGSSAKERSDAKLAARRVAWAIAISMRDKGKGIFNRGGMKGLRVGEKALVKIKAFIGGEMKREIERLGK